ncbi:hypothetical protein M8C21_003295, partial [Ambrosia artemisiifolia]
LSSNNFSLSKFKFISPNKICKTNLKPSQSQNCLLSHLLHGFQVRERRDEGQISSGDRLLHVEVSNCEETRCLAFIPEFVVFTIALEIIVAWLWSGGSSGLVVFGINKKLKMLVARKIEPLWRTWILCFRANLKRWILRELNLSISFSEFVQRVDSNDNKENLKELERYLYLHTPATKIIMKTIFSWKIHDIKIGQHWLLGNGVSSPSIS